MNQSEALQAVIAMLTASLEIPEPGQDTPPEIASALAWPFELTAPVQASLTGDPVPVDKVAQLVADAISDYARALGEQLELVGASVTAIFRELAQRAERADPAFDAREFLQDFAATAAELAADENDEPPAVS